MAAISGAERARRDVLYHQGLKDCTCCQRSKPLADFGPRSDGYRGLYGECRKCKNAAIGAENQITDLATEHVFDATNGTSLTKHPGPNRTGVL
jgi:hypothetical protein